MPKKTVAQIGGGVGGKEKLALGPKVASHKSLRSDNMWKRCLPTPPFSDPGVFAVVADIVHHVLTERCTRLCSG